MAALGDRFYFAQNKKRPAFVSMSDLRNFNLPLLQWHAMYLGTRICLQSPTNWGLCDRHKKGIYKVEPRMWQRCDRAGDGLTHGFVLNEEGKVFAFPDTHGGMRRLERLIGTLLELLGEPCMTVACTNRQAFNVFPSSSDITWALALFLEGWALKRRVDSCRCQFWAAYYPHRCFWNVRSLEVFLSIRFIVLITTLWTCFARCALLRVMFFHPQNRNVRDCCCDIPSHSLTLAFARISWNQLSFGR